MKVIYGGNASGKTTRLIKACAKTGGCIICRDQKEVYRVAEQAKKLNLEIPFPMTFAELINKQYYGRNIPNFCIDNADMLLRSLTSVPINMISITKEKEIKMLAWFKRYTNKDRKCCECNQIIKKGKSYVGRNTYGGIMAYHEACCPDKEFTRSYGFISYNKYYTGEIEK